MSNTSEPMDPLDEDRLTRRIRTVVRAQAEAASSIRAAGEAREDLYRRIDEAEQRGEVREPRWSGRPRVKVGMQTLRQRIGSGVAGLAVGVLCILAVARMIRYGTAPVIPHTRAYTTVAGQQATVTLADGSRALLGPASSLTVVSLPRDMGMEVSLVGQAFFTVMHHERTVFRVRAGNAVMRVLGTAFLVRRYRTDSVARIVVAEGRVALQGMRGPTATGPGHVLAAGALSIVDDSGQVRVTPMVAIDDYTGWTKGHLVFHETAVRDIATELGRAYGIDIRVTDSLLAARTLTWTVPVAQRSLAAVLGSLTEVLQAHVARSGQVFILVPGPSASRRLIGPNSSISERQYGK